MGFLKRLFGSTDAVEDARLRAGGEFTEVRGESQQAPAWGTPELTHTDDEFVVTLAAPGLDPETVHSEVEGGGLVLNASGLSDSGVHLRLNERLELEGADVSQADVSYVDGKLVVRVPRSRLKDG